MPTSSSFSTDLQHLPSPSPRRLRACLPHRSVRIHCTASHDSKTNFWPASRQTAHHGVRRRSARGVPITLIDRPSLIRSLPWRSLAHCSRSLGCNLQWRQSARFPPTAETPALTRTSITLHKPRTSSRTRTFPCSSSSRLLTRDCTTDSSIFIIFNQSQQQSQAYYSLFATHLGGLLAT